MPPLSERQALAARHTETLNYSRQAIFPGPQLPPGDCWSQRVTILYSPAMATKVAPKKPPARAVADEVLYLYGITKQAPTARLGKAGIDGRSPVESISCGDFTCWVSKVDRAEYADRLAENMENLDWLATAGLRHQQV